MVCPQYDHQNGHQSYSSSQGNKHALDDSTIVDLLSIYLALLSGVDSLKKVPKQKWKNGHRQAANRGRKAEEEKIVPLSHAIIDEGTMVIESKHAVVTLDAV